MTATMNQNNSQNSTKKSKDKRLLIGAIIVAIIIIIGATFAWLTSSDTVTNRLTASANYGVTITEKFDPPTIWTPGEEVTKKVSVINTGNIDAFVHVTLDNTMEYTVEKAVSETPSGGAIEIEGSTSSWVVLTSGEAHAMMAGGFLAYNSNVTADEVDVNSLYPAIDSEASEIEGDPNSYVRYYYYDDDGGTYYGYDAKYNGVSIGEVTTDFRPTESGYYIFRREVDSGTYEYEGYYAYVTTSEPDDYSNTNAYWDKYEVDGTTYYALYYKIDLTGVNDTNFTPGPDGSLFKNDENYTISVMQSQTAEVTPLFGDTITENTDASDGPLGYYIAATYEDITIRIYLNGEWSMSSDGGVWANGDWTANYYSGAWHFCYNDDLSAGETTEELIEFLYLEDENNNASWTGFIYDLNVTADSIQVTVNTANVETYEAWYEAYYDNADWGLVISDAEYENYTAGLEYKEDGEEIASITWVKPTS